ncbi:MAG: DUF479 domain-containing protein [Chitinophagaceae bacterium]|nr:DUF479 domain-containing protein [Chitinophagaceae bacterium]
MNFLAHAVLSFSEDEILVGNMISDFVKGKKKLEYPEGIQKGIRLHRMIDEFTDSHPATAEAKSFFRADYRLYSGAFVDVVYDHFLANDHNVFPTGKALYKFSIDTYKSISNFESYLPEVFAYMFRYMRQENWMYNYRTKDGIQRSFGGLVRRARYMDDASMAMDILEKNYSRLEACYQAFYPDVLKYSKQSLMQLNTR